MNIVFKKEKEKKLIIRAPKCERHVKHMWLN
jgi:hypothetical protein